jgi:hypothetical protein
MIVDGWTPRDLAAGWVAEWSKARAWKVRIRQKRIVGSNPTPSASFHTSRTLRQTDRRAEWQVSWGFWGRPVDWPDAETAENRSPEANSLQTS